jgi:hypothetical protein
MKKAILINVKNETIEEVVIGEGIEPIYEAIEVDCFDVVGFDEKNDVYVDDNGLLNLTPSSKFFSIEGYHQPLAGNGLIMGIDHETGESIDTTLSVDEIKSRVKFHTLFEVQRMFV